MGLHSHEDNFGWLRVEFDPPRGAGKELLILYGTSFCFNN